jgi:hypothetical protein
VIVAEVVNNIESLTYQVKIAHGVVSLAAIYLLYEIASRLARQQTGRRVFVGKAARLLLATTRVTVTILGIIALLGIPLLWWGVIQRVAQQSGGH